MHIKVLNAVSLLYEGTASQAVLPGQDGELSVLDYHQPFLCELRRGYITVFPSLWGGPGARQKTSVLPVRMLIRKGIAKMVANELSLIVIN